MNGSNSERHSRRPTARCSHIMHNSRGFRTVAEAATAASNKTESAMYKETCHTTCGLNVSQTMAYSVM